MRYQILRKMIGAGWLGLFFRLSRTTNQVYRMFFLARAGEMGLLDLLARGPLSVADVTRELGVEERHRPALESFLDVGAAVGGLRRVRERYALKGGLARALSRPENDAWRALVSEVSRLHGPCLLAAPGDGDWRREIAELTEVMSSVIARASRVMEPMMQVVVDRVVPRRGACNMLEIGCGSGVYVRAALERNPELTATALEREGVVCLNAQERIARSGHGGRCRMINADVREHSFGREFDLITLYNSIYYFPESERAALLERLRSWLKPGGRLALTSACDQGGPVSRLLMLWSRLCEGTGDLPHVGRFQETLVQAGFDRVEVHNLLPGDSVSLFVAWEPGG